MHIHAEPGHDQGPDQGQINSFPAKAGPTGHRAFSGVWLQPGRGQIVRHWFCGIMIDAFPAEAGPTGHHAHSVGPALAGKPLLCFALLLIFVCKKSRRHQTRLGCWPSVDDAQWAEPHGCGESAVRTWMSVRRGPTECRRSEGTRRSRAKPGAGPFWLLFRLLEKVTRRKGGTNTRVTTDNGYKHRFKNNPDHIPLNQLYP